MPYPSARASIESLESRTLFAGAPAHMVSIQSDNRGEVQITFDKALNPATVKTTSVLESARWCSRAFAHWTNSASEMKPPATIRSRRLLKALRAAADFDRARAGS